MNPIKSQNTLSLLVIYTKEIWMDLGERSLLLNSEKLMKRHVNCTWIYLYFTNFRWNFSIRSLPHSLLGRLETLLSDKVFEIISTRDIHGCITQIMFWISTFHVSILWHATVTQNIIKKSGNYFVRFMIILLCI